MSDNKTEALHTPYNCSGCAAGGCLYATQLDAFSTYANATGPANARYRFSAAFSLTEEHIDRLERDYLTANQF